MKFLLSLDYELFFGSKIGSVQKCLIDPVTALLDKEIIKKGLRASFFVDAGFLIRLREEASRFPGLQSEYDKIRRHLEQLKNNGHDVQLHIHPHWIDSHYDGSVWRINTARYKLHDFSLDERMEIVRLTKNELVLSVGDTVFAFRGGGWCIQPFDQIAEALLAENIWLESTVFFKGKSEDTQRGYDFSGAPDLDYYRFAEDPICIDNKGSFVEVPIGSFRASPFSYWRLAWTKKFGGQKHQPYGDGHAMIADKGYYLKRLTSTTNSVVSIDGFKAGQLPMAYRQLQQEKTRNLFHVMGHPKALTQYSIDKLFAFLEKRSFTFITFQDLKHLYPGSSKGRPAP